MKLDLSSFQNAVTALQKSINYLKSDMALDPDLREQFRGAVIQAFEFTHELAFKMLKRQLEQMLPNPSQVDQMAYMDIIRSAAEAGFILDVARFKNYREKRNISSHAYDQSKAELIIDCIDEFLMDMLYLLKKLKRA